MEVCNSYSGSGANLVLHVFIFRFKTNPMLQSPSSDTFLDLLKPTGYVMYQQF